MSYFTAWTRGTVSLLAIAIAWPAFAQIPPEAARYRREYVRVVRAEWGLDAPVASLAAQLHQESAWNPLAVSPAGARGLAQFMPATGAWIGEVDWTLKGGDLFSASWAMRAQNTYMRWLHERVQAINGCERMAFAMVSYNQGLGWTRKAIQLSPQKGRWFGAVEFVNPGQAAWAFKESRAYPRRVLLDLEKRYIAALWGPGSCQ